MTAGVQLADLKRAGTSVRARFVRALEHDRARVWKALTEPSELANWLAPGAIDLRDGGAARLDFVDSGIVIDSTVSAFDAGYLIEYSWSKPGEPRRPIRWEIEDAPTGVRLVLTVEIPLDEDAARAFAGWSAHLEMLEAALAGVPIKFPFEHFKSRREQYQVALSA